LELISESIYHPIVNHSKLPLMQEISFYIQLALSKSDGEHLTEDEIDVCEEWKTGKALDYLKVDTGDPRLLEYAGLFDRLENKKKAVWESIVAVHSLSIPVQEIGPAKHASPVGWGHPIQSLSVIVHLLFRRVAHVLSVIRKILFKRDTK